MPQFPQACLAALLEVTFEGLLVHDGIAVTGANAPLARLYGFQDAADMVGLSCATLLGSEAVEITRPLADGEAARTRRIEVRRTDGSLLGMDVRASECAFEGGRLRLLAFSPTEEPHRIAEPLRERARALDATVRALAETIEQRDSFTAGHQDRVHQLSVQLAKRLGVDAHCLETVRLAAHVHDIGKIAIPAEILMKPGALTYDEFQLVKGHVQAGHRILSGIDFRVPVALAVLQHHERLDGNGYPDGIASPIPEARILMVADVYDALTSARPYRAGLEAEHALAMMVDGEAGELDGEVLRHLAAEVL